MQPRWSVFVVATLVLSGCVGGSDKAASPTPSGPPPLVPPNADWGAIEGFVYDPEVLPVANATVNIVDQTINATTDADGYYNILHLQPGAYKLSVDVPRYQPIVRSVNVPLADVVRVDWALRDIPIPDPYVDDGYTRRGTLQCEVRANATGTNSNPSCSELAPEHTGPYIPPSRDANITLLPGAEGFLVELQWEGDVPVLHQKLRVAIRAGEAATWKQVEGPSVLRIEVGGKDMAAFSEFAQRNYTAEGGQIFFLVFPGEAASTAAGGAGMVIQQDYTLYVTVFYRQPPIPGYSRIPK
ncbi:MAG TPA: carboxypeptidase-like regulatory domain-containing protein [Candidatus Thermoplasmatota archaeon]|nr:carboxypeptidase-like regulatory domain-containing protein [Candidatus Thermoplasmatota archaeon]